MNPPRNIILVGFMGSGKSRVGRELARSTGWPLVDTDAEVQRRAGKPIHRIFAEDGEATFRILERQAVAQACQGAGQIIAAGGGAFVDPDNRRLMLEGGLVFCLSARPETLHRRVAGGRGRPPTPSAGSGQAPTLPPGKGEEGQSSPYQGGDTEGVVSQQRPLLAGADPLARIKELLAQRAGIYAQAHHTIDTDDSSPEQTAQRILTLCGMGTNHPHPNPSPSQGERK